MKKREKKQLVSISKNSVSYSSYSTNPVNKLSEFDWDYYKDGYTGGNKLKINTSVKTNTKKDKVFSYESYAQELYDSYSKIQSLKTKEVLESKDLIIGKLLNVIDMVPVSDIDLKLDTKEGITVFVDMTKERNFLKKYINEDLNSFMNLLKSDEAYKQELLSEDLVCKVISKNKVSLEEGLISKTEQEFINQINENNDSNKFAYYATVEEINNGGYIVDIMNVKCFLPGSLAAAGIITDFTTLIGKTIPVMIVNYISNSRFIVSYKKYLQTILPKRIQTELSEGQTVSCKVTGASKNGVFVQFKDNEGEYVFSGLVHRTTMSNDFEKMFDKHMINNGDLIVCKIVQIVQKENESLPRIILTA